MTMAFDVRRPPLWGLAVLQVEHSDGSLRQQTWFYVMDSGI